jgi:hypothetical protein
VKRLLLFLFFFIPFSLFAQQPYIDYETVGNDWVWNIFSQGTGGSFDIVANPDPSGFNTSDTVACLIIGADGDPWAGVWCSDFPDLTIDADNSIVTIMVWKDVISPFNMKLEPQPNLDHFVSNTVINQWEQLTFDHSDAIGITAQTLTLIPDQDTVRTSGSTNYWDNIDFSGTIIPVELTSFTAYYEGNTVQLKWTTASELNNRGFEIQRSIAGSRFATIGFVEGNGTTTESKNYSYADRTISPSTVYSYMLKQIDFNGSYDYSNVVNLGESLPLNFELAQNYPNPFNPSTTISFGLPVNSSVSLDVYNLIGEKVTSVYQGQLDAGNYEYNFDASNLPSGIYVYILNAVGSDLNQFTASKKMTLLK